MLRCGFDDVVGEVVGQIDVVGKLYYADRQRGPVLYAATVEDLRVQANNLKLTLLAECGDVARLIYPDDSWQLRIFD